MTRDGAAVAANDHEGEQVVLGAVMLSPKVLATARRVFAGGDFERRANRLIWNAVTALADSGQEYDPISVAEQLIREGLLGEAGGAPYLHELIARVPLGIIRKLEGT